MSYNRYFKINEEDKHLFVNYLNILKENEIEIPPMIITQSNPYGLNKWIIINTDEDLSGIATNETDGSIEEGSFNHLTGKINGGKYINYVDENGNSKNEFFTNNEIDTTQLEYSILVSNS